MRLALSFALPIVFLGAAFAAEEPEEIFTLLAKIALPDVHGRLGRMTADLSQARLFLADQEAGTVSILDARNNSLIASIAGMGEPRSIAYVKASDRLFITNGADGTVRILDGSTLKPLTSVHIGSDPDEIAVAADRVFVASSAAALAVFDSSGKHLNDLALPSSAAGMAAGRNSRLFVNLPDSRAVAVVDSQSLQLSSTWKLREQGEIGPIALDEDHHRLFVACLQPPRLVVLNMDSGSTVTSLPIVADPDALFYDPIHARVYVIGELGQLAAYAQETPDRYTKVGSTGTVAGMRSGWFAPEWNRLFVALPDFAGHPAEIRVYEPR